MAPGEEVKVKTKEDKGFWKKPGSDLAAFGNFINERQPQLSQSLNPFLRAAGGISALAQGQPAPTMEPSDRRGLPKFLRDTIPGAAAWAARTTFLDPLEDLGRFIVGAERLPAPEERLSAYLLPGTGEASSAQVPTGPGAMDAIIAGMGQGRQDAMDTGQVPFMSAGGGPQTASQLLGGYTGPDYSSYRQALTDQAAGLNAQIQAMYNQLGTSAEENVARLNDIYGGATAGIGAGYDTASANIADAYSSAQQQAADQMARLGIEDAASQILPTQALAQAEDISALEQGRGAGLSAAERYGASAGGFGSQMAQVAQQQGTEQNAAILQSLQRQLADSQLMETQGALSPYEQQMQTLNLQAAMDAPAIAQQEMALKAAEIAADNTLSQQNKLLTLWQEIRQDYESGEEAMQAAMAALDSAQARFGIG